MCRICMFYHFFDGNNNRVADNHRTILFVQKKFEVSREFEFLFEKNGCAHENDKNVS